jgi:hypothetical protein
MMSRQSVCSRTNAFGERIQYRRGQHGGDKRQQEESGGQQAAAALCIQCREALLHKGDHIDEHRLHTDPREGMGAQDLAEFDQILPPVRRSPIARAQRDDEADQREGSGKPFERGRLTHDTGHSQANADDVVDQKPPQRQQYFRQRLEGDCVAALQ